MGVSEPEVRETRLLGQSVADRGRVWPVPIVAARFWVKVSVVEEGLLGCWLWLGALAPQWR